VRGDTPGYELSTMIYNHSIQASWQPDGKHRTEQLDRHLWKWLRWWHASDNDLTTCCIATL